MRGKRRGLFDDSKEGVVRRLKIIATDRFAAHGRLEILKYAPTGSSITVFSWLTFVFFVSVLFRVAMQVMPEGPMENGNRGPMSAEVGYFSSDTSPIYLCTQKPYLCMHCCSSGGPRHLP